MRKVKYNRRIKSESVSFTTTETRMLTIGKYSLLHVENTRSVQGVQELLGCHGMDNDLVVSEVIVNFSLMSDG